MFLSLVGVFLRLYIENPFNYCSNLLCLFVLSVSGCVFFVSGNNAESDGLYKYVLFLEMCFLLVSLSNPPLPNRLTFQVLALAAKKRDVWRKIFLGKDVGKLIKTGIVILRSDIIPTH